MTEALKAPMLRTGVRRKTLWRTSVGGEEVLRFAADASNAELANVTGALDAHLRQIETELDVSIVRRGHQFRVEGSSENAQAAIAVLEFFLERARKTQRAISVDDIQLYFVELRGRRDTSQDPAVAGDDSTLPQLHTRRPDLRGRTPRQRDYIEAILAHDITIGIGPAGTGKTYLAVAAAVDALERDVVKRIVLTRPAVEAGERLGFLPGDLAQKSIVYLVRCMTRYLTCSFRQRSGCLSGRRSRLRRLPT